MMNDATNARVSYIVLVAKNPSLYQRHGYEYLDAEYRWLGIDDENGTSLGMLVEEIQSEVMVKSVSENSRPCRCVDFLGYMF